MDMMKCGAKRKVFKTLGAMFFGAILAAGIPASHTFGADKPADKPLKVNVNTATQAQLEELPGVDPEMAKKIIAARPYKSAEELSKAGIAEKEIQHIHKHLLFDKINLNTATPKELDELPFVGPVMAKKIIEHRPYANAQELTKAGFSEKKIAEIAPLVKFAEEPAPAVAMPTPPHTTPVTPTNTPTVTPTTPAPTTPAVSQRPKIDVNTATARELKDIPGLTDEQAQKIIANRPYQNAEDLKKAGFSEVRIAAMTPEVSFGMPASTATTPMAAKGDKIDVNTASAHELKEIPGLTEAQAEKIIANRPYKTAEDLKKAGFNEERITAMSPRLSFGMQSPNPATPTASQGNKIDVNTATARELKEIPGLTEAQAEKIIANRPYKNAEDLKKAGFNEERIAAMSHELSFDMPTNSASSSTATTSKKINVNTATARELKNIPGLTEAQAEKIIAGRPYKSAADLSKAGFNQQRIAEIAPELTFEDSKK